MIYRSPNKKYHKEQTLPKAQRTWELSAFARVLCPNRPETSYLFELWLKKQRGAKSGKVLIKLLRCWYHEKSRIGGSTHRPNNILIHLNLINLIWLCPPQGRHKFEFITMEKPRRLTTLCGDKVRVWLKKDCVTYLQVGVYLGRIGWQRNTWSLVFFLWCNWGQNNEHNILKNIFQGGKTPEIFTLEEFFSSEKIVVWAMRSTLRYKVNALQCASSIFSFQEGRWTFIRIAWGA